MVGITGCPAIGGTESGTEKGAGVATDFAMPTEGRATTTPDWVVPRMSLPPMRPIAMPATTVATTMRIRLFPRIGVRDETRPGNRLELLGMCGSLFFLFLLHEINVRRRPIRINTVVLQSPVSRKDYNRQSADGRQTLADRLSTYVAHLHPGEAEGGLAADLRVAIGSFFPHAANERFKLVVGGAGT